VLSSDDDLCESLASTLEGSLGIGAPANLFVADTTTDDSILKVPLRASLTGREIAILHGNLRR